MLEGLDKPSAAQGLSAPGFCTEGRCYLYSSNPAVSVAFLPPRAGSWVMILGAVCKSRPLDHTREVTASFGVGRQSCAGLSSGAGGHGASSTPARPPPGGRLMGARGAGRAAAGSAGTAGQQGGCTSSTSCCGPASTSISRPAFTARRWLHDPDAQVPAPLLSCLLFSFAFCSRRQST